jgi:hypothetical protein
VRPNSAYFRDLFDEADRIAALYAEQCGLKSWSGHRLFYLRYVVRFLEPFLKEKVVN